MTRLSGAARSRLTVVVAVTLLVGVALAGCSPDGSSRRDAEPPVTETRGPRGAVPAGLERFYGQPLTWESCAGYATTDDDRSELGGAGLRCARLRVPLDYAKPDGDPITLGLLRSPAAERDRRIGSLVVNPGGPGVAGLSAAVRVAREVRGGEVGRRFDVVGFDPRGVGSSEPQVRCLTDDERDEERADDDELDTSPAGIEKVERDQREFAARCAERTGNGAAMLANLGSRDVARDLDVLRSVLGDEGLNYVGYSYGTRIGSTYAEAFPANARALVLDGALDPNQDPVTELVAQGEGFQVAFDDFVAWCVRRQDCALGRDAGAAVGEFHELVRPLGDDPLELRDGRVLSYSDATTGVVQALYGEELWEPLNTALNGLRTRDGELLMRLADFYLQRDADGHYSTTQDVFTAVRCVDDRAVTDRAVVLAASERYREVAPFLDDGRPASSSLDACAFWPVPNTSDRHVPSASGLKPVLVVSTTNDPATPYAAGVALAAALGGRLLTFEATQHTIALQGNDCVDAVVTAYLVDGTLPADGARCS